MPKFISDSMLAQWFRHHPPTSDEDIKAHEDVREQFERLALRMNNLLPEGPHKTVALRAIFDAAKDANACIALGQKLYPKDAEDYDSGVRVIRHWDPKATMEALGVPSGVAKDGPHLLVGTCDTCGNNIRRNNSISPWYHSDMNHRDHEARPVAEHPLSQEMTCYCGGQFYVSTKYGPTHNDALLDKLHDPREARTDEQDG